MLLNASKCVTTRTRMQKSTFMGVVTLIYKRTSFIKHIVPFMVCLITRVNGTWSVSCQKVWRPLTFHLYIDPGLTVSLHLTDNKEHCLIPILYRKCDIPAAISPLYYCDYPRFKDDPDIEEFFWNKLYQALSHDPAWDLFEAILVLCCIYTFMNQCLALHLKYIDCAHGWNNEHYQKHHYYWVMCISFFSMITDCGVCVCVCLYIVGTHVWTPQVETYS